MFTDHSVEVQKKCTKCISVRTIYIVQCNLLIHYKWNIRFLSIAKIDCFVVNTLGLKLQSMGVLLCCIAFKQHLQEDVLSTRYLLHRGGEMNQCKTHSLWFFHWMKHSDILCTTKRCFHLSDRLKGLKANAFVKSPSLQHCGF